MSECGEAGSAPATSAGIISSGVALRPNACTKGAKTSGAIAWPTVPLVMCVDIAIPRWLPDNRCTSAAAGGWNAAPPSPPSTSTSVERDGIWRQPDQRDGRDTQHRPGHEQQSRPPSVGDVAKAKLRDRVRELKEHLQRTCGREREVQVHDEQRQQGREDVAEAVDDEVRACEDEDGGMEPGSRDFIGLVGRPGVSRSPCPR